MANLCESTRKKILALESEGCDPAQIAVEMGLARQTVDSVLKKSTPDNPRQEKKTAIAAKRRAAWLRIQGWRLDDIARVTSMKPETIENNWKKWAVKYGIKLPEPKPDIPPATHGPVITYKLIDGQLVEVGSEPPHGMEDDWEEDVPVCMENYRKMMEDESCG